MKDASISEQIALDSNETEEVFWLDLLSDLKLSKGK